MQKKPLQTKNLSANKPNKKANKQTKPYKKEDKDIFRWITTKQSKLFVSRYTLKKVTKIVLQAEQIFLMKDLSGRSNKKAVKIVNMWVTSLIYGRTIRWKITKDNKYPNKVVRKLDVHRTLLTKFGDFTLF